MKAIIDVQDVWKIYQMGSVEVPALRGLDITINKGDFAVIMGPSGSGKSTAMNMVGALDLPTKGIVKLDGRNIAHMDESTLAQVRGEKIGFVFQTFNLIPTLTAIENVTLPMIFKRSFVLDKVEKAKKILRLVGLGERMTHRPGELSGGERQRVAIARSLANDPEIILADEPTGNLDSKMGEQIMDLLLDLHEKHKKTLIIVTHDPRFAKLKGVDNVFWLKDGAIEKKRREK
ncbi:ABC transporter ATP-binding protein [Candidatus Woesearchaeota archaeon]|jgi:putative ABC transport system ATP-binding protein|nr:ABC transporter ATP-binding protein [Candidatus Woesearchaeota archaeon]MBT7063023.1 ABC transporter ATP-binding protein [Candidatus Woesearchaeota archaeon]MBT7402502.1 ABC transporter ATP-binding protein [Candidatus Woesearchaeota archaeon]